MNEDSPEKSAHDKQRERWVEISRMNHRNWRSWDSPVGLGIWFVSMAAAFAIVLLSVAQFIVMLHL